MPTEPTSSTVVVVCAHNEEAAMAATLDALAGAFPQTPVVVADDASTDTTPVIARAAGAQVVAMARNVGKGGAATAAARRALEIAGDGRPATFLFCDADLGESAASLPVLSDLVRAGTADLAVGAFERREGGGFGIALGFARWAIRRRCGLELRAPISGQRALSRAALEAALPFAPRFGMEIGMTIDVARAGLRVAERDLPLRHRATRRDLGGFLHRGRQLADFALTYATRR